MQKITPFLWFDGNAEEALHFYSSIFKDSAVVNLSRYGDSGPLPKGTVMVATIEIFGQQFSLLNGGPQYQFTPAVSFMINCEGQDEVDYYWDKLSEGGELDMCGWLRDKYGLSWQVIPTILIKLISEKDPKKANHAMQAMLKMKKIIIKDLEDAVKG